MGSLSPPTKFAWKTHYAWLEQIPPVLDTYYEVFNATGGVVLHDMRARQENTGAAAEAIDVLITVDGREIFYDSIANLMDDSDEYTIFMRMNNFIYETETDAMDITKLPAGENRPLYWKANTPPYSGDPLKGHAIRLQVRQHSGVGAGAEIHFAAIYDVLEAV